MLAVHEGHVGVVDVQGHPFKVGQQVAKACVMYGISGYIEIALVSKVTVDKVYLNGSNSAIKFPNRLAIINPML